MQRCNGKTKTGAPCRAPAAKDGLCFFHGHPDAPRTLGQIGGRKNRAQSPEPPAAGSLNVGDLRDIIAETIYDVRAKKISPRIGGAIAQLSNAAHRVLQTADLEARLARLEQQLAEQERRTLVTDATKPHRQEEGQGETNAQPDNAHTPEDAGDSSDGSEDE